VVFTAGSSIKVTHQQISSGCNQQIESFESLNVFYNLRAGRAGDQIPRFGGEIFRNVLTGPGAHPTSYTMNILSFPGVKRPGRGVDHPPPPNAEVKESFELCYYYFHLRGLFEGDIYVYIYIYIYILVYIEDDAEHKKPSIQKNHFQNPFSRRFKKNKSK
jgi:hypothetical protein